MGRTWRNDILNSGKTDKTFKDALKRYYKPVYPESTDRNTRTTKKAFLTDLG